MERKLRYGCIGAGGIARKKHLSNYAKQPDVELVAVCDSVLPAAEALARDFGIDQVYSDYREMLDRESLDIISVCTPNFLHREITCYALEHGVNVHCEKPLAMDQQEALEIWQTAERTGKKVMLGLNKRYLPETLLVHEMMKEDFFGEIYHARCGWRRNSGIPGIGRWFTNQKLSGGGVMIDLGVHYLDLAMSYLDYPDVLTVSGSAYQKFGKGGDTRIRKGYRSDPEGVFDVEDMAVGIIRTASGATVDFEFSWASNVEKEMRYIELMGTKGGMIMENDDLRLFSHKAGTCFVEKPDMNTLNFEISEFAHFIQCIRTNTEPITNAWEGYKIMKIIDAFYASAKTGAEVRIGGNRP